MLNRAVLNPRGDFPTAAEQRVVRAIFGFLPLQARMGQIGQCIFGSALSHTRRSDPLEKKEKKIAWTFWPNSPVDKFRVLAFVG